MLNLGELRLKYYNLIPADELLIDSIKTLILNKMKKAQKRVGIWMDHASAHIMEYTQDPIETENLESKFTHQEKLDSVGRSEHLMHNKEQHEQADYYKKLGEIIRNYDEVVLFGPTDAKVELFNILTADHRFAELKIFIKQADKMTENQQHAFVKDYFSKQS